MIGENPGYTQNSGREWHNVLVFALDGDMRTDHELQRTVLESQGLRFNALSRGPADGELALCLHGFPQFADSWLDIMGVVANAGFYAFAVDQRGYSPGARPLEVSDYATAVSGTLP